MLKISSTLTNYRLGEINNSSRPSKTWFNRDGMNVLCCLAAATDKSSQMELLYVWEQATPEAKAIIVCLFIFSIIAWSVMVTKAIQMRRAKKLNHYFDTEFKTQKNVLDMFDRKLQVEGCPLFMVYEAGSMELDARLKNTLGDTPQKVRLAQKHGTRQTRDGKRRRAGIAEAGIGPDPAGHRRERRAVPGIARHGLGRDEHVRGTSRSRAAPTMAAMAPGVSAALITTVAGLLVAIPSMFGYNWLVHNLRVFTVELDNFAQELVSKMETEYSGEERMNFEHDAAFHNAIRW